MDTITDSNSAAPYRPAFHDRLPSVTFTQAPARVEVSRSTCPPQRRQWSGTKSAMRATIHVGTHTHGRTHLSAFMDLVSETERRSARGAAAYAHTPGMCERMLAHVDIPASNLIRITSCLGSLLYEFVPALPPVPSPLAPLVPLPSKWEGGKHVRCVLRIHTHQPARVTLTRCTCPGACICTPTSKNLRVFTNRLHPPFVRRSCSELLYVLDNDSRMICASCANTRTLDIE